MYNPFFTSLKAQEHLFLATWRLNQQLLRGYLAFWEGPDATKLHPQQKRSEDWRQHITAYPCGASLNDHYGSRSKDVDVERI